MEAGRPEAKRGFGRGMLIVGILGLATSFPALMGKPEMFYRSYLLAFVFWNGLAVGSLASATSAPTALIACGIGLVVVSAAFLAFGKGVRAM